MEQQGKKGLAIAALILGIASIVLAWWYTLNIAGIVCGVVGLILAINAGKSYKVLGQKSGLATAGLIVSIIGLVLSVIGFISCTLCIWCAGAAVASDPDLASSLNELNSLASQLG